MSYREFLQKKSFLDRPSGMDRVPTLSKSLFPFQRDIVNWALRRGRAAVFADCGMGKTAIQLEWARHVPGDVLILAPLAVAAQTVREGDKFGIPVNRCLSQDDVKPGINIANYERLDAFNPDKFHGVVLDESSILKSYDGKTRTQIISYFKRTPFRLAATATPSPNDYMELGNHAEYLGVMSREEMLAMFFVHDCGETQKWRIKGHAEKDFWEWVCSWAVMIRKPSDLGYDDGDFKLPALKMSEHIVRATGAAEGELFAMPAATLAERIAARRGTVQDRAKKAAEMVNASDEQWLVWCNLNSESERLAETIDDSIEVRGSDSTEYKENAVLWFMGDICKCKLKNRGKNTRADGLMGIGTKSASIDSRPGTQETQDGGNSTHQNQIGEPRLYRVRKTGKNATQKQVSPRTSKYLDSRLTDSENSSKNSQDGARSAEEQSLSTTHTDQGPGRDDSILTTAIKAGECADSYVRRVISGSESSKTTQRDLSARPCTCGGIKTKRVLISKSSIFGFGLNFQKCRNMAFVGLTDSYEELYQAVRRCWRFGQKKPVNVNLIVADIEGAVLENIKRKENDAENMAKRMVENMKDLNSEALKGATKQQKSKYKTAVERGQNWEMRLGDCVEETAQLETGSVHYSIYSPPFASLYTYSNSDRDMGNCKSMDEFLEHYRFLVKEIYRATMPGRLTSFHCMDLPTSKVRDGIIGLRDFRGELIRIHQEAGWAYHSGVTIWKDPVTAMQRTKAIGLLYKQLKKDSHLSRQGIPDYLITMRKPGDNPKPISHTPDDFPVDLWQKYASPVWMDINPNETLQYRTARDNNDERHICPLQLEVIRRGLKLWSAPGDTVLSPFGGIASEGYESVKAGRKFIGIELKESYYKCAVQNLVAVEKELRDGVLI